MDNKFCILYASCIPVKGSSKSIICDLQRHNYVYIPMDLYTILKDHKRKTIGEIKAFYKNQYDNIIDDYFKILVENEFAFFTDTPDLFPDLSMEWKEPFEVTNAILDIDNESSYNIEDVLKQLSGLHCKFIQLRFYKSVTYITINRLLHYLDSIKSNTIGIDLLIPFDKKTPEEKHLKLFEKYKRLNSLIIYNSSKGKCIKKLKSQGYYIHTAAHITSEKDCGCIDPALFSINVKTFTEALTHNSCLNGKISVDRHGEIRNCPSMTDTFGNISKLSLKEVLAHKQFKKYWKVTKDTIQVCKDCEFRYICTDCRAYVEEPMNDLSKPLKCGYNPYTGKWSEQTTNELKNTN